MKAPRSFWRLIQFGPRMAYSIGLGPLVGRSVLLLTTFGRKSGLPRVTPLVYELRGEAILVASARGPAADWLRNLQANPRVTVRVGSRRFEGIAQQSADPEEIADYLQRQLDHNPRAFGAILRADGLPTAPSRADLVLFAPKRPLVIIHPTRDAA